EGAQHLGLGNVRVSYLALWSWLVQAWESQDAHLSRLISGYGYGWVRSGTLRPATGAKCWAWPRIGTHHTPGCTITSRLEPGLPCRSYVRFDWQRHPPKAIQATRGGLHLHRGASSVGDGVPAIRAGLYSGLSRPRPPWSRCRLYVAVFRRDER